MLRKVTCEGPNQMNCCHRKFGICLTFQSFVWIKLRLKYALCSIVQQKTHSVSLNDAICAAPKLQKDLFDVLIGFRRNLIAKEMYLQVEIEERDHPYFRLLWRDLDSSREPDVYEFNRVVFGKNSAPKEVQFVTQGTRMCIHWQLQLCSNPLTWMTRLIVWKLCKMAFSCTKSWTVCGELQA